MNIVEIFRLFPTHNDCIAHLEEVRWDNNPTCPYCKSHKSTPVKDGFRHHCNNCYTSYSVTVGTIFHHTHLPIQKWFLAVTLILNAKKGISARQLARDLDVNKNTAWRISMKIRDAMYEREQRELLTGIVEADETYIGGKPRKTNNPNVPKDENPRGRGTKKPAVVGFIERGGKVKAQLVNKENGDLTAKKLSALVRKNVDTENSILMTDEFKGYIQIKNFMGHKTINHSYEYANGDIHTNTIESFWAILKRGIVGQFHKVSLRYLPKYLDEFCYRFNYRHNDQLFEQTIKNALGV
ncbi:MAG: IS1595 family transposase [Deltaproteobacteria bacterium]|nr:IS1595 family transposase [Deltaproteobacteria bacterium]